MSTCDLKELRPAKRTRISSPLSPSQSTRLGVSEDVQDDTTDSRAIQVRNNDGSQEPYPVVPPKCPNVIVPNPSNDGFNSSSNQDEMTTARDEHELSQGRAQAMDPPPMDTDHLSSHPVAEPTFEKLTDPNHEDSLTPLTEEIVGERVVTIEATEDDLEISQYDIWSDFEQEELDVFDENDVQDRQIRATVQPDPDPVVAVNVEKSNSFTLDKSTPFSQPSSSKTVPSIASDPTQSLVKSDHEPIEPSSSTHPSQPDPRNPNYLIDQSQSQASISTPRRTVSSLFTTGAGEPFPIQWDRAATLPSSSHQNFLIDLDLSFDLSPGSNSTLKHSNGLQKTSLPFSEPSQSPCKISSHVDRAVSKSQQASPSIFQTAAAQPYPLQTVNKDEINKSSLSTGNQVCPIFGFQTARGNPITAPAPEFMEKALSLCTTDFTSHPKRHQIGPESPSPSHRAKAQKAFQSAGPLSNASVRTSNDHIVTSSQFQGNRVSVSHHQNEHISESNSTVTPITHAHKTEPSAGLFSTGRGAPINIPHTAIERARALLDNPQLFPKSPSLSVDDFRSPLRDRSNLRPSSDDSLRGSIMVDPSAGSSFRQPDLPSRQLSQSLSTVAPRIPSQPTTAASLMSTPVRVIQNGLPASSHAKSLHESIPMRPGHHSTTAPVRRISNRMHIGLTPQSSRRASRESKGLEPRAFVTPFKKNVELPQTTSIQSASLDSPVNDLPEQHLNQDTPLLKSSRRSVMYMDPPASAGKRSSSLKLQSVFDLSSRSGRAIPMSVWLASPKGYSARHLLSLAIPESVVFMTSKSAAVWSFNALTEPFGAIQALGKLLELGCLISRSTPQWVANHWGLIIGKLAGMVRWQPDCLSRVWNPCYVVQQLQYRYEREFLHGHRSAVKRILDRDCPSGIPLCLFVAGIRQEINTHTKAFSQSSSQVLELSDGWYKIKASMDPVLARTLKRGVLKVGCKIAIGSLSTEMPVEFKPNTINKKNPNRSVSGSNRKESLDDQQDEEPRLFLEGNTTSRAKWYEPLGFRIRPWFSSIRSLTHDGGRIPMMDILVVKIFPHMFIDEDGRLGRWGQAEENMLQLAWEKEREKEASKILAEQEKEFEIIQGVLDSVMSVYSGKSGERSDLDSLKEAEILEGNNGGFDAENMCDELIEGEDNEGASLESIRSLSLSNLLQLRHSVQKRLESFRLLSLDRLQKALNTRVPIRRVRNVQLLKVQDFRLFRYHDQQYQRIAQLIVQDLSQLSHVDFLKEGNRYWVQNLQPQRGLKWNARLDQVEIFLSTRRDTRWTRIDLDA